MKNEPKQPKLNDLPASHDEEFWGDAEKMRHQVVNLPICDAHTMERWMEHHGYRDNHDGTISCRFCSWGTRLPGYLRVHEGRIVDLRNQERD